MPDLLDGFPERKGRLYSWRICTWRQKRRGRVNFVRVPYRKPLIQGVISVIKKFSHPGFGSGFNKSHSLAVWMKQGPHLHWFGQGATGQFKCWASDSLLAKCLLKQADMCCLSEPIGSVQLGSLVQRKNFEERQVLKTLKGWLLMTSVGLGPRRLTSAWKCLVNSKHSLVMHWKGFRLERKEQQFASHNSYLAQTS